MSRFNLPWPDPYGIGTEDCWPLSEIDGVTLVSPKVHREPRGDIFSLHREGTWDAFVPGGFAEEKVSFSRSGVLRGFHGDMKAYKLITCLNGTVQLALLDARRESPTYGKTWHGIFDRRYQQVLIPPGVLNAHLCIAIDCVFHYKQSALYSGTAGQLAVRWDTVGIPWRITSPVLSARDAAAGTLDSLDYSKADRNVVVAVSGYFNPLHSGHLSLFREAKKLGDDLVVIVNNDLQREAKRSVPFMDQEERLRMVCACRYVDRAYIASDSDMSVSETLEFIKPAIFANGGDVKDNCREAETCRRLGIKMVYNVGGEKTQSSSDLIARATQVNLIRHLQE